MVANLRCTTEGERFYQKDRADFEDRDLPVSCVRAAGTPPGTPADAIVNVYRSADEVFHPESLASFENLPITIGHPRGGVTPKTAKGLIHGVTTSPVTKDAEGVRAGDRAHVRRSADRISARQAAVKRRLRHEAPLEVGLCAGRHAV